MIDTSCSGIFRAASPLDERGRLKVAVLTDLTVPEMAEHVRRYLAQEAADARDYADRVRRRTLVEASVIQNALNARDAAIIRLGHMERVINELLDLAAKVKFYEEKFGKEEK